MVNYITAIDTIGLQINCDTQSQQQETLQGIENFLFESNLYYVVKNSEMVDIYRRRVEYLICANETLIAKVNTGITTIGRGKTRKRLYYLKISFAGLKRHNDLLDKASKDCLLRVCAYLNTHQIKFSIKELDICLDVYCPLRNMLAVCIKKTPNTKYYTPYEKQPFQGTKYIEKVNVKKPSLSVVRSYYYDKAKKEDLLYPLSRFELKLNSRYFNRNDISTVELEKVLNRYNVMYFQNMYEKSKAMDMIDKTINLEQFKANKMMFDINYIDDFLCQLYAVFLDQFKKLKKVSHT